MEEVKQHSSKDDAWTVLRGRVRPFPSLSLPSVHGPTPATCYMISLLFGTAIEHFLQALTNPQAQLPASCMPSVPLVCCKEGP